MWVRQLGFFGDWQVQFEKFEVVYAPVVLLSRSRRQPQIVLLSLDLLCIRNNPQALAPSHQLQLAHFASNLRLTLLCDQRPMHHIRHIDARLLPFECCCYLCSSSIRSGLPSTSFGV